MAESDNDQGNEAIGIAINCGRSLIAKGHSKLQAATFMYPLLWHADREAVVAAFGAALQITDERARIYWFFCRWRPRKRSHK
jgi:hypothetical protein